MEQVAHVTHEFRGSVPLTLTSSIQRTKGAPGYSTDSKLPLLTSAEIVKLFFFIYFHKKNMIYNSKKTPL
jgi:hypothetical protein